jgi:hypothetical protein
LHIALAIMTQTLRKPITLLSVAIVAVLTIGVALAERMEQRANEDRFSMGDDSERVPVSVD